MAFFFVYVVDNIDIFPYIKPFLHPWDEAYLIMVDVRFDVFLDSVGKFFKNLDILCFLVSLDKSLSC